MWHLRVTLPRYLALDLGKRLEEAEIALSISCFEKEEDGLIWSLEALFEDKPLETEIKHLIGTPDHSQIQWEITPLEDKNWLAENRKSFTPISVGSFYIHGAHVTNIPPHKTPLQLDASTAFGSGEHASTKSCLQAIEHLCGTHNFNHPLDMGCGTGILALAMAHLNRKKVLATDIDPEAVSKTIYNARTNNLSDLIEAKVSQGWDEVLETGFDLVVANILAGRLCEMAPSMKTHMKPEGYVVLSGLLSAQREMVIGAYVGEGFHFYQEFLAHEWSTLVMVLKA